MGERSMRIGICIDKECDESVYCGGQKKKSDLEEDKIYF